MYKFSMGDADKRIMVLVLQPEDLRLYRAKPCDDRSEIDCTPFGRPDLRILLTYARKAAQVRKFAQQIKIDVPRNLPSGADFYFSGFYETQLVIGLVLSERTMRRLEAKPMAEIVERDGIDFGVHGFSLMITYSPMAGPVINFLRGMGVSNERLVNDPALRPLYETHARELLELAGKLTGHNTDNEPMEITIGKHGEVSEDVLLAVRGEELAWFAAHPGEHEYLRRVVPGEFPTEIDADWVKVVWLDDPNHRARVPMWRTEAGEFVESKPKST